MTLIEDMSRLRDRLSDTVESFGLERYSYDVALDRGTEGWILLSPKPKVQRPSNIKGLSSIGKLISVTDDLRSGIALTNDSYIISSIQKPYPANATEPAGGYDQDVLSDAIWVVKAEDNGIGGYDGVRCRCVYLDTARPLSYLAYLQPILDQSPGPTNVFDVNW